jgi:hypothetical protein
MHKLGSICFLAVAAAAAAACTGTIDGDPYVEPPPDPYDVLDKSQQEGPPRYSSRIHGCTKMRYATLGNVLASRGVALGAAGADSAGRIYRDGRAALGGPNYPARVRETIELGLATT